MRAIIYEKYGGPEVLKLRDVPRPELADGTIIARVHAAGLNPLDFHRMRGTPALIIRPMSGLRGPKRKILGADWSGVVEEIGPGVAGFQPGDEVFGGGSGTLAEYVAVAADRVASKPANVSHEQAAATPVAALTALQALRDAGRIAPGQQVLVNGAAGGVGTFVVQIAKSFGAHVTGVCSTRNIELLDSLGADRVIDYTREDFTADRGRYDIVVDAVGNRSLSECKRILKEGGRFVAVAGPVTRMLWLMTPGHKNDTSMITSMKQDDLEHVRGLIESGAVTPVVDRTYPLAETAAAMAYLEEGHARGKVVITI